MIVPVVVEFVVPDREVDVCSSLGITNDFLMHFGAISVCVQKISSALTKIPDLGFPRYRFNAAPGVDALDPLSRLTMCLSQLSCSARLHKFIKIMFCSKFL